MWCITIMHCYALLCMYLFIYETDVQNSILNNFHTFIIIFGTRQLTALLLQSWVFRDKQMLIEKSYSQSHIKPLFLMVVWEGCNRLELNGCFSWMSPKSLPWKNAWKSPFIPSIYIYKTGSFRVPWSRAGKKPSSNFSCWTSNFGGCERSLLDAMLRELSCFATRSCVA